MKEYENAAAQGNAQNNPHTVWTKYIGLDFTKNCKYKGNDEVVTAMSNLLQGMLHMDYNQRMKSDNKLSHVQVVLKALQDINNKI